MRQETPQYCHMNPLLNSCGPYLYPKNQYRIMAMLFRKAVSDKSHSKMEVSLRMAMYKCESCGKESSSPGMCCGAPMKQVD
jgi:hypothetical protein